LLQGKDPNKDQSYFLCQLTEEQLSKALFPIGELLKPQVRAIAKELDLVTAEKKDSQGLCFVGKISLPTFLQQQLKPLEGNVIEVPNNLQQFQEYEKLSHNLESVEELAAPFSYHTKDGIVVASHQGAHYYTIGQRKGLKIGGRPEPSFVIGIDTTNNLVYSGQTEGHIGLNKYALKISNEEIHWINSEYKLNINETLECDVKIRYRQNSQKATLIQKENGLFILFNQKQKAITSGQFAAFYLKDELIGSGVIAH
jgi:tRNA-specific 2-thiouridylase